MALIGQATERTGGGMKRTATIFLMIAALAAPVLAQSDTGGSIDTRVGRLEKEMRSVQRKIFPGGAGETIEAEIQPTAALPSDTGSPASTPAADLAARVDALERSMQDLTGQVEQQGYKQRQLDDQMTKLKSDYDYRLSALEKGAGPSPAAGAGPPTRTTPSRPSPASDAPDRDVAVNTAIDAAAPTPSTGDPAEDAYMTGYRLWTAKKFADAEAALKAMVTKYPDSKRASYAQNLLGRAYLDEGKPGLAADAFYTNYKKMPRGERAPDSLYYLGQSLMKLKKPADACKVYSEFEDVYGAKAIDSLKAKVAQAKTDASCGG